MASEGAIQSVLPLLPLSSNALPKAFARQRGCKVVLPPELLGKEMVNQTWSNRGTFNVQSKALVLALDPSEYVHSRPGANCSCMPLVFLLI
uniref:Uncharacterized protein n=1 Tax=Oryza meridionalis TaxID=40149 RepID=A0A0E0E0J2_9ORYZ